VMRRTLSAGCLIVSLLFPAAVEAGGVSVKEANKEQLSAAEKTFRVADDLFDKKRFGEALTAYRASYDIVASPNSRLMVARSLRELGRLGEAYRELEGAVAEAQALAAEDKKYENTERAAQEELEALKKRVAFVVIELPDPPEGTQLVVAGKPVALEAIQQPLVLAPGSVTIKASAPGRPPLERRLDLAAGSSTDVRLDLNAPAEAPAAEPLPTPSEPAPQSDTKTPAPSDGFPMKTAAYIAGGVGVLGFAAFGIFGSMNNSKFDSLDSDCNDGRCPEARQSDIDAGRRYQTFANVGLVVGVVGVGTGITLFLLDKPRPRAAGRAHWVSVGAGQLRFGGRFE
jgi:hypothetical protein